MQTAANANFTKEMDILSLEEIDIPSEHNLSAHFKNLSTRKPIDNQAPFLNNLFGETL